MTGYLVLGIQAICSELVTSEDELKLFLESAFSQQVTSSDEDMATLEE